MPKLHFACCLLAGWISYAWVSTVDAEEDKKKAEPQKKKKRKRKGKPKPGELTEEQKLNFIVYVVPDNPYYHNPDCYSIKTAIENKSYNRMKLGEAHNIYSRCPHCDNVPKLLPRLIETPRDVEGRLHKRDPYRLSKPTTDQPAAETPEKAKVQSTESSEAQEATAKKDSD